MLLTRKTRFRNDLQCVVVDIKLHSYYSLIRQNTEERRRKPCLWVCRVENDQRTHLAYIAQSLSAPTTQYGGAYIAIILWRCVYVWGYVCLHDKTKKPDCNELKLGTVVVVIDTLSKPIDLGFKMSRVIGIGSSFRTFGSSCHIANKTDCCLLRLRKLRW